MLGLLVMSTYIGYERYQTHSQYVKLDKLVQLSIKISTLVHDLQIERGFSSAFVGSVGMELSRKLIDHRKITDKKLKNFHEFIKEFNRNDYASDINELLDVSLSYLNKLPSKREEVDFLVMNGEETISYYTNTNSSLIEVIRLIPNYTSNTIISKQLNSYTNFLLAKEKAGVERAEGALIYSIDMVKLELLDKFKKLIFQQEAFLYSFEKLTNEETFNFYKRTVKGKAVEEVNRMRKQLLLVDEKHDLLSEMKEIVGYGGYIHNFKNYLMRRDMKYEKELSKQYKDLTFLIQKYKNLFKMTKEEKELLDVLQSVFDSYDEGIEMINQSIHNGKSLKELDKIVKVDDLPAIDALHKLSLTSFYHDSAKYWIEQITLKINLLKDVNDYLIDNYILDAKEFENNAKYEMIFYILFSFVLLLFLLSMGQIVMKDIIRAVKQSEDGLHKIAGALQQDVQDKTLELIQLNKNLEHKVQDGIESLRKKDEMLSQQAKLAAMGEMMGAIAHQWRQPLNTLSISIQFLEDDFDDGLMDKDFIQKFIQTNMKSINFMSKTIDDFRNFFRVDKLKSDFEVQKCIEEPISILTPQLKNHNINIEISGNDFVLNGLRSEFQQVILNIINNAKDALVSKEIENAQIQVKMTIRADKGCVTIEDNAGGIPSDVIDRVFEPYFTTKEQGKGTGIGLYMSKMIVVDNMSGEISVTNTTKGAKFEICVPLFRNEEQIT